MLSSLPAHDEGGTVSEYWLATRKLLHAVLRWADGDAEDDVEMKAAAIQFRDEYRRSERKNRGEW